MKKPNLLLLHGALGAAKQFAKLQQMLEPEFNVYILDFRGHGKKDLQNDFSIDAFADEVKHFIVEKELAPVNIFGYSMGGYVALQLASEQPQSVSKIFTLATKFDWNPKVSAAEVKKLNPEKVQEKVPQFAEYLKGLHGEKWPALMNQTAELMISLGKAPSVTEKTLQNINIPVRVAVGDRDNMVTFTETEKAYRQLPQGQMQVFPLTPHPLEKVSLNSLQPAVCELFLT